MSRLLRDLATDLASFRPPLDPHRSARYSQGLAGTVAGEDLNGLKTWQREVQSQRAIPIHFRT